MSEVTIKGHNKDGENRDLIKGNDEMLLYDVC